jgi:hypothetical protein
MLFLCRYFYSYKVLSSHPVYLLRQEHENKHGVSWLIPNVMKFGIVHFLI